MARTSAWLSAGIGAGHRVGEQPVAPPDAEGPYRVLLCVAVDAVAPVVDVALELAPLRRQVMQRLPQQALGQHGMQVGQQQLFDVGQHGYAVVLPPAPELVRIHAVAPGLRFHFVQLADQRDEPRGQLTRPALILGQCLQCLMEVPSAMGPAPQVYETVRLGNRVLDLVAVGY